MTSTAKIHVPSVAEFRKPRSHDEIMAETMELGRTDESLRELAGIVSRPPKPAMTSPKKQRKGAQTLEERKAKRTAQYLKKKIEKNLRDEKKKAVAKKAYTAWWKTYTEKMETKKRARVAKESGDITPKLARLSITERERAAAPVGAPLNRGGRPGLIAGYHHFPTVAAAEQLMEPGDMMIARQYTRQHKDGHAVTTFTFYPLPVAPLFDIVFAKTNINLFEQIRKDDPRKMYFDVDNYGDTDASVLEKTKEIITRHFGEHPMAISGSVRWLEDKGKYKHSYHIVLTDTRYENHAEMQAALGDMPKIYKEDGFDPAAYASRQNMKMPFQSKAGSDRVQNIIEGDVLGDHFITQFFAEGATAPKARDLPVLVSETPGESSGSAHRGGTTPFVRDIQPLATPGEVPVDFDIETTAPEVTLSLIKHDKAANKLSWNSRFVVQMWAKGRGIPPEVVLQWTAMGKDITDEYQSEFRREWGRTGYEFGNDVIMSILKRLYPAHNFEKNEYAAYHDVKADVYADYRRTTIEQCMGVSPARLTIPEFSSDHKVEVWHIGMGCGKTEQLLNNIKVNPGKRTLIITCRCSLVDDIHSRCREAGVQVGVYNKFGKGEKDKMRNEDVLIINGESLGYIRGAKAYDFVYIDEWESFTDTWTSHETHARVGLRKNWEGFMDAWTRAGKVVLMDAFITKKTTAFLEETGDSYRIVGSKAVPRKRSMNFLEFEDKKTTDTDKVDEVIARVVADLKEGKNILMFYPRSDKARKTGIKDIEEVKAIICKEAGISDSEAIAYYGDQDCEIKNTLRETNRVWTKARVVICNSCVTVGVSFTQRHFHREYIVAPNFLTVRAVVQFSYRARNLSEDRVDVCYLNSQNMPQPDRAVLAGMMEDCTNNAAFGLLEDFAAKEQDMACAEYMAQFATFAGYEIATLAIGELRECPWVKRAVADARTYDAEYSVKELASGELDEVIADYKQKILTSRADRLVKGTMKKYYYTKLFPGGPGTEFDWLDKLYDADWEKHTRTIIEYLTPTPRTIFPYAEVLTPERKTELEKVAYGEFEHEDISEFSKEECELYGKKLGIKLFLGKRQNTIQMANELLKRMFGLPLLRYKKTTRKYEFLDEYSAYLKRIIANLTAF